MEKPSFHELEDRIRRSLEPHGDQIPDDLVHTCDGYLGALIEWGLISVADHERLCRLLPERTNSPIVRILAP